MPQALGQPITLDLDDGASSTLVAGGTGVNLPSGGVERTVGEHWSIARDPE